MEQQHQAIWLLLLFSALLSFCHLSLADDPGPKPKPQPQPQPEPEPEPEPEQQANPEPAFPVPLEQTGGRLHLISEQFDSNGGYLTREEYVDLNVGKATFMQMSNSGQGTFHMDANTQSSYYYSPYECWAYNFPDKPAQIPQSGFWVSEQFVNTPTGESKKMYLTGVTAIWLNAKSLPKVYSREILVYSPSKDNFDMAHKWEAKMGDSKASFYFHETRLRDELSDQILLSLETIELETGDKKTSINLLAHEFELEEEVYVKELQLPLSYGCSKIGDSGATLDLIQQIGYEGPGDRFKLEAIATKQSGEKSSSSDKISLELVRSNSADAIVEGKPSQVLQLLRQRSSRSDNKTVLDHVLNVEYELDMMKGTCEISNIGDAYVVEETQMTASFPNGLELKLDKRILDALFFVPEKFQFVKSIMENGIKYVYLTRTCSDLFKDRGSSRIVRKYSLADEYKAQLESVTMWLMDEPARGSSDIHEIYHFTILESSAYRFMGLAEKARIFDISEECYLNNEKEMKYGRDFVWLELHYTVAPEALKQIPDKIQVIKRSFYEKMRTYAGIGWFRIPRLEVMLDEVGFTLRLLLLDSPPLHYTFERTDIVAIVPKEGDELGYFTEIAPDLRHCSELCRLNRCSAFSFCENSYSCVIGHPTLENVDDSLKTRTVSKTGCTLLKMPSKFDFDEYNKARMHNFIGGLQRHDLANLELPKPPERRSVPESDLEPIEEEKYASVVEYAVKMKKFLEDKDLNSVTILTMLETLLITVPDRFEVEQDPLAEFSLDGKDELQPEDQSEAPAFHDGLSQRRFNYRAFENNRDAPATDTDTSPSGEARREARRYVGVEYEQCALACLDGKCSSFSYCKQRQECIITNMWDLQAASASNDYLQADVDCAIAQRDFLSKFHKLREVRRPPLPEADDKEGTRHVAVGANPSECAHGCVVESGFNCLAFTFCLSEKANGAGTCFYSERRTLQPSQWKEAGQQTTTTNCDHYSRSYLADFTRIEYRQLVPEALNELKTSQVEGESVDRCAERCATELMDCTAFQFCYDPEAQQQEARQRCTMIESPPKDKRDDYRVVVGKDGQVLQAGKVFANNQNCHVFALKRGSSEAELRQLALNPLSKDERADGETLQGPGGMSVGAGFLLFLCSVLVFSALGVAFVVAQKNSAKLRSRMDHLRALVGRYQ